MARPNPLLRAGHYLAIAYEFIGAILAGSVGGWLLDRWLGLDPWGLLAGTLLGFAAACVRLVQMLRRLERFGIERRP